MDEFSDLIELYGRLGAIGSIVQLAILVLMLVSMWCVYKKAGQGGWKILIPIYGSYIRFKIAGCTARFWVQVFLWIAVAAMEVFIGITAADSNTGMGVIATVSALVFVIVALIIGISINFKLAKAFGLSGCFGLGLWWLPVVFYPILAFNSNIQYQLNLRKRESTVY